MTNPINKSANITHKPDTSMGGQTNIKTKSMKPNEESFFPFVTDDSTLTHFDYDHDSQHNEDLNCYSHKTKGESIAYNSYCENHALSFFSDEQKTPLSGKHKECFVDPRYPGVSIHSIRVGESELSFFAENNAPDTLTEGSDVIFAINAFVTEVINPENASPRSDFVKLENHNGQAVNQNEYQICGTIVNKVARLGYNNCDFVKYLLELNIEGQKTVMPVITSCGNLKNDETCFAPGDPVNFNVVLQGMFL